MTATACQSTDPHAHVYVAGPEWIDAILRQLRSDKNRITQQRIAVLNWIAERDAPFTAEEVVSALDDSLETCANQVGSPACIATTAITPSSVSFPVTTRPSA